MTSDEFEEGEVEAVEYRPKRLVLAVRLDAGDISAISREARRLGMDETVELLEETEPEQLALDPQLAENLRRRRERKEVITIRISAPHLAKIRRTAHRKGIPYQTLIQLWLAEALGKEI